MRNVRPFRSGVGVFGAALLSAVAAGPAIALESGDQLTFAVERSFHDHAGPGVLVSVRNHSLAGVPVVVIACSFLLGDQRQSGASKLMLNVAPGQTKYDELRSYGRADRADCFLAKGEPTAETAMLVAAQSAVADAAPPPMRNRRVTNAVSKRTPKEASHATQNAQR